MKITEITVEGEKYLVRKLKYRERMRMGGLLRIFHEPEGTEPELSETGEPIAKFTLASVAEYQVQLLASCIVNEAGQPFYNVDEIDEWENDRIQAIVKAVNVLNNTGSSAVEEAKGNSEATASEGSSSS